MDGRDTGICGPAQLRPRGMAGYWAGRQLPACQAGRVGQTD